MAAVTIRKLNDEAHLALKVRAKAKGRSAEAEMREILEASVRPKVEINIANALEQFGRKYREELSQIDFDSLRDKSEIEPAIFE